MAPWKSVDEVLHLDAGMDGSGANESADRLSSRFNEWVARHGQVAKHRQAVRWPAFRLRSNHLVHWYLRYKLSFRDLIEMMSERGLSLAHTTIMRWVKRFTPEFVKR